MHCSTKKANFGQKKWRTWGELFAFAASRSIVEELVQIAGTLKAFSGGQTSEKPLPRNLADTVDVVLGVFQNQISQGVEGYHSIPLLPSFTDGLSLLWAALVQFSIRNMEGKSTLIISIRRIDKNAIVSLHNSGATCYN